MKKWMYVIFPGVALAVFLFFYFDSRKRVEALEAAKKAQQEEVQREEDAHKKLLEETARKDAEVRRIQREQDDRDKAEKKIRVFNEALAAIQAKTAAAQASADLFAVKADNLRRQVDELSKKKEDLIRETFDQDKGIELINVQRRAAELEIQRYVDIIAKHADDSVIAKMPPPLPPADTSSN